jgi:adenosylcobinamide-phosphate synthase
LGSEVALVTLLPNAWILVAGVLLDLLLGDPHYPAHPVRLMGWTLSRFEELLRKVRFDGYLGGILLLVLLSAVWVGGVSVLLLAIPETAKIIVEVFLLYSLLALRDLLSHVWAVERAASRDDLKAARVAISKLVGRDTDRMDVAACRRAAIESLSENLTDGFISPIFWYAVGGLPGVLLFKVVSTMDSMVGYKTPRYLKFGWCGARTDDLMNWIPARMTWLLLSLVAAISPGFSGQKALRIGWQQHAIVPGPNSGWSEAATAGGICRQLVGPIWAGGNLVTDVWLGDPGDPPAGNARDIRRAIVLITATGLSFVVLACLWIGLAFSSRLS